MEKQEKKDFTIIFKEIEKFHIEDSTIKDNIVNDEELQRDESIRIFGEICKEINNINENSSTVFMTFS